ncbi:MAG: protein BatD [Chlorobiaceae bacterium]|nr:protein BatD [Chlorobiaceae bacterium]
MRQCIKVWMLLLSLIPSVASAKFDNGSGSPHGATPYLDTAIDNRTPYVGQEVLLTYSLYFSGIAPRIVDAGKAEHTGLWVQEVTPEGYIGSSVVKAGGRSLRMAVIKQLKLVPMQEGKLTVSNYRLKCLVPSGTGTGTDSGTDIESIITAPTATIIARPLPQGAPEGFIGAVGDFSILVATNSSQVRVGEPLTLAVKIRGRGNLKTFPQVELELPKGFRRLDGEVPTVTSEAPGKADDAVYSKIALTSDQPGNFSFRPVKLTAFNPWKGRYETVASGEVTVKVLPPGKASGRTAAEPVTAAPPSDRTGWVPTTVMLFMAAAFLALIAMLFLTEKKQRKQPDPIPEKRTKPPSAPRKPSMTESPELLKQRIYNELGNAGINKPAGLTSQQLRQELEGQKIGPECWEAVMEVMEMIDHAVYTPGKISGDAIEKLNRKAAEALELLHRGSAP